MGIFTDNYGDVRLGWYVIGVVVAAVVGIGLLWLAILPLDKFSCSKLSQSTGIETRYSVFGGGCLVKVNNRFIPQENWRGEYEQ